MLIKPDYSEAFEQVNPGQYRAVITEVEGKTSKNNNRYLAWKLQVQPSGMTMFHNTMIEGKGSGMLKHFIKCAMNDQYEEGEFDTDAVIGKSVLVDLQFEKVEYKGEMKDFLRVKKIDKLTLMNSPQIAEEDLPF